MLTELLLELLKELIVERIVERLVLKTTENLYNHMLQDCPDIVE